MRAGGRATENPVKHISLNWAPDDRPTPEHMIEASEQYLRHMGWHEHHHELFPGTERFFRPNYAGNLVNNWIPALEGVEEKLKKGARVADVGCGLGASTILMAKAYPASEFTGFDYHDKSIEAARQRAKDAGVGDRVKFEMAKAKDYPGKDFDFVAFFDCLHDMGDPVGAAAHVGRPPLRLRVGPGGRVGAERGDRHRRLCDEATAVPVRHVDHADS